MRSPILASDIELIWEHLAKGVESGCDAVVLGSAYLLPPLSFGGASLA